MMKENLEYSVSLFCGKNKKKVDDLYLSFGQVKGVDSEWYYSVHCTGVIEISETELVANSRFHCIVLGSAYLRQALRMFKAENPKMKFYEKYDGVLEEITIEDIFWTHDCVEDV